MKSVTICASNRFAKEALEFAKKLEKLGVTVFVPPFYTSQFGDPQKNPNHDTRYVLMGLTHDHFQKIRRGDTVFIYNKDGYSGNSVTLELGYATALGKPVYALSEKDVEMARDILFSGYAKTPQELVKFLR